MKNNCIKTKLGDCFYTSCKKKKKNINFRGLVGKIFFHLCRVTISRFPNKRQVFTVLVGWISCRTTASGVSEMQVDIEIMCPSGGG